MKEYNDCFTRVEVTRVSPHRVYATAYTANPLVSFSLEIACCCEGGTIHTYEGGGAVAWMNRTMDTWRPIRSRPIPWTSHDWIVVIESLEKFFKVKLDRPRV